MALPNNHPLVDMPAYILAGGLGTRLRSAVADRPKVLASVRGRPFLTYLLDQVNEAGIRDVVLCIGYQADYVRHALGSSYRDLQLWYSEEEEPLGTAGALRLAFSRFPADRVLALNGDSYCDADLGAIRPWHEKVGASVTILLAHVDDTSRFGSVKFDSAGRITEFVEKKMGCDSGWINSGIYLLNGEFLASIPLSKAVSLEREVFPAYIGWGMFAYRPAQTHFLDIGTPEAYALAERFFQEDVR